MSSHDPIIAFIQTLETIWQESTLLAVVRFFVFVYVLVLIVDIVLLVVVQGGLKHGVSETLTGAKRPQGSRHTYIKRWEKIRERLETANESQYKVAVFEADTFAFEVLGSLGYEGENLKARLDDAGDYAVESKNDLLVAHSVRNKIIRDSNYVLSRAEAETTLDTYRTFLDEVDIL